MSEPRNRRGFERGRRLRAEIRALLEAHPPLARPLTAPVIRARLTCRPLPALRTVQWHLRRIWDEAEGASLSGANYVASGAI